MKTNLYEIMKSWTVQPWNRETIDSTLDHVAAPFYAKEVAFFLIDDIVNWLEEIDGPFDSMMPSEQKQRQFKIFLDDEKTSKVARDVELDIERTPELKLRVLNVDALVTKYPEWFEKYKPMTWNDVEENLRKAVEEKKGK
ncbi:MAG: hypothetical protein ACW98Y_19010 [Candidatus Thorarchaeota archaeon]